MYFILFPESDEKAMKKRPKLFQNKILILKLEIVS